MNVIEFEYLCKLFQVSKFSEVFKPIMKTGKKKSYVLRPIKIGWHRRDKNKKTFLHLLLFEKNNLTQNCLQNFDEKFAL